MLSLSLLSNSNTHKNNILQTRYRFIVAGGGSIWKSFWIWVVFYFVIYSGILAYSRHLLRCRANLSWMDVNFLKLESIHHGRAFFTSVLSWVLLLASLGVFQPMTLLWVLVIVFFMLFIHLAFLLYSFCFHILLWNYFISFASDC